MPAGRGGTPIGAPEPGVADRSADRGACGLPAGPWNDVITHFTHTVITGLGGGLLQFHYRAARKGQRYRQCNERKTR